MFEEGSKLKTIGGGAFAGCTCLERIEMGADCGALAMEVRAAGGKLTVGIRYEAKEESSESVWIEMEDTDMLRE